VPHAARRNPFRGQDAGAERPNIDTFDFDAPAELFMTRGGFARGGAMTYRRFPTAAAAVRFAVEEMPTSALLRATMEVKESRFDHRAIRALYDRSAGASSRRKSQSKAPPALGRGDTARTGSRPWLALK
jgi:hypothetical protein